jgi:hypothetical protein
MFEKVLEDFKAAADEVRRPVTLEEIATQCGVSLEHLHRSMLAEDSQAHLPPPRFWKGDLAYLARERAEQLVELADELEASVWGPVTDEELEEIGSMILDRFDKIIIPDQEVEDLEKRRADFEARREEIEERRTERKKQRTESISELNEIFRRSIIRNP